MTDIRLAKKWIKDTKAEGVIAGREKQLKIALSLLRAWRRYKKTGRCPWTGTELYDYTFFLHAFGHRYAGNDDELYHWLTEAGLKMLDTMQYNSTASSLRFCPVCGRVLTPVNTSKGGDYQGEPWCTVCANSAFLKKLICP